MPLNSSRSRSRSRSRSDSIRESLVSTEGRDETGELIIPVTIASTSNIQCAERIVFWCEARQAQHLHSICSEQK